jgi:type I restriction enzyme, S subunit
MTEQWRNITLGQLCEEGIAHIQTGPFGSQLHSHEYQPTGVPIIPTEAIGHRQVLNIDLPRVSQETAFRLQKHWLKTGDILFARRGIQATGYSAIIDEQHQGSICSTGAILLRILDWNRVDPTYLSFWFAAPMTIRWLKDHAVGAVMPNLNDEVLRMTPLHLPPLKTQRAIARVLSALDEKIELNRRANQTLEHLARAVFQSWFVNFDPVRARLEGRDYPLRAEVLELFPTEFDGDVPKGWIKKPFLETVSVIGGATPKTSEADFWNGDIDWFSVVDAPQDGDVFVIDTQKKITEAGLQNSATRILETGTTIISARGTVGKIALVGREMAMNQSCYGLRGKDGLSDFYTYFNTQRLVLSLQQNAHGGIFDTITRDTFQTISVAAPTPDLTSEFDHVVRPFLERILSNLIESKSLVQTRDSLLPKLLSGEITVRNAEKILEES